MSFLHEEAQKFCLGKGPLPQWEEILLHHRQGLEKEKAEMKELMDVGRDWDVLGVFGEINWWDMGTSR